uniref:DNA double-strand break repair rad50 ATPase,putative n=1 Tax=Schistosoma mansoni TaxID=6183 RepID=A0A3Q0KU09_SCHMA
MDHLNIPREENFFSKFGQYEFERAKKREELMQDYLEFKEREEKNFHNRFSDKKKNCHRSQDYSGSVKVVDSFQNTNESFGVQDELPKSDLGCRLMELEKKINTLFNDQRPVVHPNRPDLSDKPLVSYDGGAPTIKELKNNSVPKDLDAENNRYEELKKRLHQITEADKRLSLIEEEYNKLKNVQNPYALDHSNQTNQGFRNLLLSSWKSAKNEVEYSKQNIKDNYRKELELQITEAEKKRSHEKAESIKGATMCSIPTYEYKNSEIESNKTNPNEAQLNSTECLYFDVGQRDLLAIHTSTQFPPSGRLTASVSSSDKMNTVENQKDPKFKKMQYAEELKKQIEEARAKKAKQKEEDEEYNRKIEEQNCNVDLSRAIHLPQQNMPNSINSEQFSDQQMRTGLDVSKDIYFEASERTSANAEPNFARGGHGIFGSPLTEVQKNNLQKYKKELAQQIAEKRQFMELKKQKEVELEQREMERIRAERLKMQKEFETEQERRQNKVEQDTQQLGDKSNEYKLKRKEEHTADKTKSIEMRNTRCKRPSKNIKSPTCSPKILIGPEASKLNDLKQSGSETSDKHSSEKTQSILKQLNALKAQLDREKSKTESMYYQQKHTCGYNKELIEVGTCKQRSRPRINIKAVELFQDASINNKNNTHSSAGQISGHVQNIQPESSLEEPYREDLRDLDRKQIALLRKQDNHLQELRMELLQNTKDKSRAHSIREKNVQNCKTSEIRNPMLDENNSLIKPQDKSNEIKHLNSSSNEFIDLSQIAEKNKQRLLRLDAIQLLTEVSDDPESVLQRFVGEHDRMFSSEHKNNIF